MQLFAKILLHKRLRASPFSRIQWDKNLNNIKRFEKIELKAVVYNNKKRGTCDYCHKIGQKLTKEHILPKSYGGCCILIHVCRRCNEKRGNSPCYPDFIRFIYKHPRIWKEAKATAQPLDAKRFGNFLNQVKFCLHQYERRLNMSKHISLKLSF